MVNNTIMELSSEDNLRLNVLLAQNLQAVRIDESKMIVYALTDKGEAKVPLNPNCKDEKYIHIVKALFSTHVMGSPGGYPVFLERWTRMGQARGESLAEMLMLGEPEAVVAVVHAAGLTDVLAERAWWAMPSAENARRMLEKTAVAQGKTGPVLADFLVEFLPFEEEQRAMIESVRLVLKPGLISEEEKMRLWARASNRNAIYVGFLHSQPDDIPDRCDAHPYLQTINGKLRPLIDKRNKFAVLLERVLNEKGQAFLKTSTAALKKPGDQDVVVSLLEAISSYFLPVRPENHVNNNISEICVNIDELCERSNNSSPVDVPADFKEAMSIDPAIIQYVKSMLVLSCLSVKLVNPIFSRSDAIGTVMRKKIKPIVEPIQAQINNLQAYTV